MKHYEQKSILGKICDYAVSGIKYAAIGAVAFIAGCTTQLASHAEVNGLVKKLVEGKGNYGTYDQAIPFVMDEADYNKDKKITKKELERFVQENPWIEDEYQKRKLESSKEKPEQINIPKKSLADKIQDRLEESKYEAFKGELRDWTMRGQILAINLKEYFKDKGNKDHYSEEFKDEDVHYRVEFSRNQEAGIDVSFTITSLDKDGNADYVITDYGAEGILWINSFEPILKNKEGKEKEFLQTLSRDLEKNEGIRFHRDDLKHANKQNIRAQGRGTQVQYYANLQELYCACLEIILDMARKGK
jgi:hypothetical protein